MPNLGMCTAQWTLPTTSTCVSPWSEFALKVSHPGGQLSSCDSPSWCVVDVCEFPPSLVADNTCLPSDALRDKQMLNLFTSARSRRVVVLPEGSSEVSAMLGTWSRGPRPTMAENLAPLSHAAMRCAVIIQIGKKLRLGASPSSPIFTLSYPRTDSTGPEPNMCCAVTRLYSQTSSLVFSFMQVSIAFFASLFSVGDENSEKVLLFSASYSGVLSSE
mmetsp:Transcript_26242/g.66124  ORF Transcript_26242/g.66124 Transcript_26242/m.66124 type:complete len:217 (-) Transcript_26242:689-1339(-)